MASGVTTTTNDPWSPIQPYLVGGVKNADGTTTPGVADQAANLYRQSQGGMPDYLQNSYNNVINGSLGFGNSTGSQLVNTNAQNILSGSGAPTINPVGNAAYQSAGPASLAGYQSAGPAAQGQGSTATADQAQFNLSNLGMGSQPVDAYGKLLSGNVNTDPYNATFDAASHRLTDNFNNAVMPAIGQGATVAGQYGGSRQGVAEGLAAKGLGQAQSDLAANMYGNAYTQAQNNMANAAGQLGGYSTSIANSNAGLGTQANIASAGNLTQASLANAAAQNNMAQFNAGQYNQNQQFNSGQTNQNNQFNSTGANANNQFNSTLGLSNNQQAMNNYSNNVNAANTASGMIHNNATTAANVGNLGLTAANNANNYNWQQLGNYQGAVQPLAGLGSSTQNPYYTNNAATVIGAAGAAGKVWDAVSGLWK